MSFIYSCIGDNLPENREHLEKIGFTMSMVTMDKALYVKTQNNGKYYETNKDDWSEVIVDCIGNPQLFQAVTAMRDNSDELQYFTDGASWLKIPIGYDIASFLYTDLDGDCGLDDINKWHKATLSELQAHFQRV